MERDEWYRLGLGDVEDAPSVKTGVPVQAPDANPKLNR